MSQGDVAIITGASGGIGRAIAEAMLEAGRHVVSLDRRMPGWSHARLEPIQVDLFDPKATAAAAKDVAARHAISHVVHNAGIIRPNLIEQVTVEDIAALSQLHLGAALTLVQTALPGMKQRHFGRIDVVAPGPVETDMFHEVIPQGSPKVDQLARSIPVGRIGRPSDVARAVMFFASRDADFITGQALYVCGGASIGSIGL